MEQAKLSLSDPVEKYVPRITKIQVLDRFIDGDTSKPYLHAPKSKPTIHQLLTHTSGFSYDFFDVKTLLWRLHADQPPSKYNDTGEWEQFETPFQADPGTKYIYGVSTDWLGFVIEAITGMPLPEYVDKAILQPLGMRDTSPYLVAGKERLVTHVNIDGKLSAYPELKPIDTPKVWGGGSFLSSTMNDFAKLLSSLLNSGTSPQTNESILKPETVRDYVFADHLSAHVDKSFRGEIGSSIPAVSNNGSFFPSLPLSSRSWSCGLMRTSHVAANGAAGVGPAWAIYITGSIQLRALQEWYVPRYCHSSTRPC